MKIIPLILIYQWIAVAGLFGFYSVEGMTPDDFCLIAHMASGCTLIAYMIGNLDCVRNARKAR